MVFKGSSQKGNGFVTVTSHPFVPRGDYSALSAQDPAFSRALAQKQLFWRVLRFNEDTRQSVNLVIDDGRTAVAVPTALAFDYIRSMASVLAALRSLQCSNLRALQRPLRIMFLGCGGGTLAYFAHEFYKGHPGGVEITCVDIDGVVLTAAQQAMGLRPDVFPGIQLIEADAAAHVRDLAVRGDHLDLVVFDVFDGDNETPAALLESRGAFLRDLRSILAPGHGALIMNLHADDDKKETEPSIFDPRVLLGDPGYVPDSARGDEILGIALTFANELLESDPDGDEPGQDACFTLGVRRQRNVIAVVARGVGDRLPEAEGAAARVLAEAAAESAGRHLPWLDLKASAGYGLRRLV